MARRSQTPARGAKLSRPDAAFWGSHHACAYDLTPMTDLASFDEPLPTSQPASHRRIATPHPGLAKVGEGPLVQRRTASLYAIAAGRWRRIIEAADVMSEGRTDPEGDRLVYYGSTSVLLFRRSAGGEL